MKMLVNCAIFILIATQPASSLLFNQANISEPLGLSPLNISSSIYDLQISDSSIEQVRKCGYLNVNKGKSNSSLYYTFFGKEGVTNLTELATIPMIIWLEGGPGGSSQYISFNELGPFSLKKLPNGTFTESYRNNSWSSAYNLLFIDNPIGTGASYAENITEIPDSQEKIAEQFFRGLQELYLLDLFKGFVDTPLFLAGVSYGGKYVISIAKKILEENVKNVSQKIPLKGISIGDGFVEPMNITAQLGMFGYNLAILDYQERMEIERKILNLHFSVEEQNWDDAHEIFNDILGSCAKMGGGVSVYNYRKFVLGYGFKHVDIIKIAFFLGCKFL